ncbi:MAG TPA: dihydrofolate reductase family protein [Candidatus Caenarcaniphilales bacterium]
MNTPKVVFSRTIDSIDGQNIRIANGAIVEAVNHLKQQAGKDILVYGGATFVSSLIEHRLIDELNLFVNPVAIGDGMRVFKGRETLKLTNSTAYTNGVVVNTYEPH